MDLTIMDRLLLLGILPAEGDITTLRIVRDLRTDLSFSEEDLTAFEIVSDAATGLVRWNAEKETPKDVTIGAKARRIITEALERLSNEKRLKADYIPLYERFVDAKD